MRRFFFGLVYILLLAIYLEDTLNTSLTCIVLVSEKHCSMFNANKLCIVYCYNFNHAGFDREID